ncbi:MAG: hypothetical protein JST42_06170 [Bacteroidetes bacterium]|nr:hypothetical protein [Bacteroidota bacterium]
MIKLRFDKVDTDPEVKWEFLSIEYPLPFSVRIGSYNVMPATIYARNIDFGSDNFIEFRFDDIYKNLFEISIVTVQNSDVSILECDQIPVVSGGFYRCVIEKADSVLDSKLPMQVARGKGVIRIDWVKDSQEPLAYFTIGKGCYIGIDAGSFLSSLVLTGLSEELMENIFG